MLHRTLKMYFMCLRLRFATLMTYRANFLVGATAYVIEQLLVLLFIDVVLERVGSINGWGFWELAFLYGMLSIPRGISNLFGNSLWILGGYIRSGDLDRLMTRPAGTLIQMLADHFYPQWIGQIVTSGAILGFAGTKVAINWDVPQLLGVCVFLCCSTVIYFAIFLFFASTAFWTMENYAQLLIVGNLCEFARYPLEIYPPFLRIILTWILPIAFGTVIPSSFLLGKGIGWMAMLSPVIAMITLGSALSFWHFALSKYQSSGS